MAAPSASSSPTAAISRPRLFLEVARHFTEADPSVIMGVGSIVDAPTAGLLSPMAPSLSSARSLMPMWPRSATAARSPTAPAVARPPKFRRRGIGLRDRQGVSGLQRRWSGLRQDCAWPHALDAHRADRRCRCPEESLNNGSKAGVVCVGIGRNLITKEMLAARTMPASKKRWRDHRARFKTIRGK